MTLDRFKFCLLTLTGKSRQIDSADFVFFARRVQQLTEPDRHFSLTPEDILLLNPNTQTCPIFRSSRDAELTKSIYKRVPVFLREQPTEVNPWRISFLTMFHMANDSNLFKTKDQLESEGWRLDGNEFKLMDKRCLPLYEGKMFWHFDHRFGTYEGQTQAQANQGKLPELDEAQHADPLFSSMPRYWVDAPIVNSIQHERGLSSYYVVFRDVTSSVVLRTSVFTVLPAVAVGHKAPILIFKDIGPHLVSCFLGCVNSFPFDYLTRQSLGGSSLSYFVLKQLPIFEPCTFDAACSWNTTVNFKNWLGTRVLELIYTAWDLKAFAEDFRYTGAPFQWDDERRFLIRCELEAAFFHLYGIARDDVEYIMETFPIVKRRDEQRYSQFRTKRVILEIYDEMAQAIAIGQLYQTRLDPPPADPAVAHPPRVQLLPLVLPSTVRYPQPDSGVYMMRVILSMLQESGGAIDMERLMNACSLLAMPDKLEKYGARIEYTLAHEWRTRFSDQFRPDLFLAKLDDLVQRGEIRLIREGAGFKSIRVSTSALPNDAHIEFDARFALRVGDSLVQAEKEAFTPLATREQIEERSLAA